MAPGSLSALASCAPHWARAAFRNLGDFGLKRTFTGNPAFKLLARHVMATPCVPAEETPGAPQRLAAEWGRAAEA